MLLVEHFADGHARHIQRVNDFDIQAPQFAALEVATIPRSIERTKWACAAVGCLDCGHGWSAIGPERMAIDKLECVKCSATRSAIVEDEWCTWCGASQRAIREPGCPRDNTQCGSCGQMKAVAA